MVLPRKDIRESDFDGITREKARARKPRAEAQERADREFTERMMRSLAATRWDQYREHRFLNSGETNLLARVARDAFLAGYAQGRSDEENLSEEFDPGFDTPNRS